MKFKLYISFFLTLITFTACQKNLDVFVPDPGQRLGPDTTWVNAINDTQQISLLMDELALSAQADSVEVTDDNNTVLFSSGIQCEFTANSLVNAANEPVAGKIKVEALLLKTKGDLIRMNKPTVSDDKLLVSGGAINIHLTKNDEDLTIDTAKELLLKYPVQSNTVTSKLFYGEEIFPGVFNWAKYTNDIGGFVTTDNQEYSIKCGRTGWISPALWFDINTPETSIDASLPAHFTNANTKVFLVFKNSFSVVAFNPDVAKRKFASIPLPSGEAVTMVVLSRQNNEFYLGHTDATISAGSITQQVKATPVKVSFSKMNEYLSSL
ncbi:MAG: hypothetical protein QM791_19985 [Ferruginibacter sp.]